MTRKTVQTANSPLPVGPYSQAVISKGFIFTAGQIGIDPEDGKLEEGIAAQTVQALNNLEAILIDAGSNMDSVVKINVYLADISDSAIVNDIYSSRFMVPFPARSVVAVSKLPLGALIEIEAVTELKEEQY
ncbi:MAG: Rid family detoxifying hydrolase [Candidatus Aegiribacteria sp.]|nr:Rid family detoxifying hydrolase [Candidatus Aegiribacteria sp.]